METSWVDFRLVKENVTMEMILNHYGVNWLRKSGSELRGRCPIHQKEGSDAFHVSVIKNAFNCFSCKAKGNVLDFVAAMEKSSVREAALKLKEWFSLEETESATPAKNAASSTPSSSKKELEGCENPPLTFQLRGVDCNHPSVTTRGIAKEIIEEFGVGYFSGRGSMAGRIVIPIHDERGQLVAYAGRVIDESEPKYKFPVGFKKSLVLFNLHRVNKSLSKEVVLVEGFFDCMKVSQAGYSCVALMGSSLSTEQELLLKKNFERVVLLLDGDEPGRAAGQEIAGRLVKKLFIRMVDLEEREQPDMFNPDQIKKYIQR